MKRLTELSYASDFYAEECIHCFAPFAMSKEHRRQRKDDGKSFWCPACGQPMCYRESEKDRELREAKAALERAESQTARAKQQAVKAEQRATAVNRQYKRIRDRVKNGVCPCCNRTFQNLANHMKTEHPAFGNHDLLRSLREAYGLTQAALAEEIWVKPNQVSLFERNKPLPQDAEHRIEVWLLAQTA